MIFFAELKRRNVVRVGIAYVIVGWLLAQIAEFAAENFGAPDWALKIFVVFVILGLPLALFFAWAFELTPEGIVLEKHVDREKSITPQTGRKLDFVIIAVMALALIYLVADKFIADSEIPPADESSIRLEKSIAVLPFVNMSEDKDYFADGLSEELLNLLARIPDLKVAGRTSSFTFKGKNEDLRVIGSALGVSTVLEGSVRRSGDRLRVTAQLVNVDDGFHIWSETYDREMADIFDIQDDVASAITSALQLHLAPGTSNGADRPTQNTEAYSLYLEAFPRFREANDPLLGIDLLDRALSLDPSFAKAHEAKAILYWTAAGWFMDSPAGQKLVFESAQAALAIDPTLVVAKTFFVTADIENWTWLKDHSAMERAVGAMPNDSTVLHAYCWELNFLGYYRASLSCADRLIQLEPLWSNGRWYKAEALMALGRPGDAYDAWQKAAEVEGSVAVWDRVIDHLLRREDEEAIALMEKAYAEFGLHLLVPDAASVRSFVEDARNPETGEQYLRDSIAAAVAGATIFSDTIWPNIWYLAFGNLEAFFDVIDQLRSDAGSAWSNGDNLERTARYLKASGFAAHPRFIEMQKSSGMVEVWEQRGPPDDCSKQEGKWICE